MALEPQEEGGNGGGQDARMMDCVWAHEAVDSGVCEEGVDR